MQASRWINRGIVTALSLAACRADLTPPSDPTPEVPGPVVSVSQERFSWSQDAVISVTLTNPDGAPVYPMCRYYRLQRYRDGWRTSASPIVLTGSIACPTARLAPGDSVRYALPLTNDYIPFNGWYRIVLDVYRDSAMTSQWEERSRASPAFLVTP